MTIDTIGADREIVADAEAVVAAIISGQSLDPVIVRRIQARTERIQQRILHDHGPIEIAVSAIRELRDA